MKKRNVVIFGVIGLLIVGFIEYFSGVYNFSNSITKRNTNEIIIPSLTTMSTTTPSLTPEATPKPTELPPIQNEIRGFFNLKSDVPAFEKNVFAPTFLATANHRYEVIASEYNKVQINFNGLKGWIPAWYLLQDINEQKVVSVKPYQMIVETPVTVRLYPGEQIPSSFQIENGKVVNVYKEYNDWVCVYIVDYAEPIFGDLWILKKDLKAWDPMKAKEGLLKEATKYADQYNNFSKNQQIMIYGEKDGKYEIRSFGGSTGVIDKEDFIPNPFLNQPEKKNVTLSLIDSLEISTEQKKTYKSYSTARSDIQLKNLGVADIFKFYLEAILRKDYKTLYGLYIKGEQYGTPSRELFFKDLNKNASDEQQVAWSEIKLNNSFVIQENFLENDQAVVFIVPHNNSSDNMKIFRLLKNKDGFWKVNWMPMQ